MFQRLFRYYPWLTLQLNQNASMAVECENYGNSKSNGYFGVSNYC